MIRKKYKKNCITKNIMSGFIRKKNEDGVENPKYIDLLDEDKKISGQSFVCISFISPEKILKRKELFFFEHFLKYFDFTKSMKKFTQFINFLSYKYGFDFDNAITDLHDFVKTEKENLIETSIEDDWKNFMDEKEEDLEAIFNKDYQFKTNTRGVKIRGSYPTQEEAELRCRMLREVDSNHDVYVGPVGMWMPWDPEAYKTGRVEYMEEELNQLMKEKNSNEIRARQIFDQRVKDSKRKAIEENKKLAKETGNKLTQNINKNGELVSVENMNTIERNIRNNEVISTVDIRRELFEGENVRVKGMDNPAEAYKKQKEKLDKETQSKSIEVTEKN